MNYLLLTVLLALSTNIVNANPWTSRIASLEISKKLSRACSGLGGLRMSDTMVDSASNNRKRFFNTKLKTEGYKPKETHETHQLHILPWPKKVEYLDDTYEVFRTPPDFMEQLEESLRRTQTKKAVLTNIEKKK